jgi:hypothetical protein
MATVSRGQYWAMKEALTASEKELINFYELQWHLRQHVPTIEEVTTHLKKSNSQVTQVSVNYYLQRKNVVKALDKRGIPWRQHTQSELTATQVAAAVTMMNFADTRSNDEKLDQLGINPTTYYSWLNDPQFKNLVDSLADRNLTNIRPTAVGEFTKLINKGDWKAIQYFLDVTGELKGNDVPQSEQLLKMIIEIIQRHVKDPETIVAIAQDIKLASANRTLEIAMQEPPQGQGQLQGHIYDPELEDAKKKLGIN